MLALADNDEIESVKDLKDKVIGALAISDFAGAQVQFYVMVQNGMDYIMDPKQVIFTGKTKIGGIDSRETNLTQDYCDNRQIIKKISLGGS